jgi:hypothetical protein
MDLSGCSPKKRFTNFAPLINYFILTDTVSTILYILILFQAKAKP